MVDKLQVLLVIEGVIWVIIWMIIVWYEAFSRNPQWAEILAKVNNVHRVFVYLVVLTGLVCLIVNKMI